MPPKRRANAPGLLLSGIGEIALGRAIAEFERRRVTRARRDRVSQEHRLATRHELGP
jgi:hypothetical protein